MDGEGRLRRRGGPVGAADIGWRSSLWFCHDPRMTGITAGGAELDAALNRFVTRNGRPGAAAGVVHGDEVAWVGGAGFAEVGAQVISDPGTLYRIASITKTFTGTAVMQLRDAGRLDLDDPAVKYLPELRGAVSPVDLLPAARLRRAGRGLAGSGRSLTAGDAQAPVPG